MHSPLATNISAALEKLKQEYEFKASLGHLLSPVPSPQKSSTRDSFHLPASLRSYKAFHCVKSLGVWPLQKALWSHHESLPGLCLTTSPPKKGHHAHCIGLFCFVLSCSVFSVESKTQTACCCLEKLRKKVYCQEVSSETLTSMQYGPCVLSISDFG